MLMQNLERAMHYEIYWANLNPTIGREQAGHRPVLVVSNDIENQMDIITVVPITSRKEGRKIYPNELLIHLNGKEAIVLCHQVRTISKKRLDQKITALNRVLRTKVVDILCMRFQ